MTTTAPSSTSECPARYFVALCTTTSAPRSSGFWPRGVANVESTTTRAPAACAAAATAAMSTTSSVGFVGVSSQTMAAPSAAAISSSVRAETSRRLDPARLVPPGQLRARAAVRDGLGHHDAAHRHQVGHGGDRGHAAREADRPAAGTLERGQYLLERAPRRVADPRVGDRSTGGEGRAEHGRGVHRAPPGRARDDPRRRRCWRPTAPRAGGPGAALRSSSAMPPQPTGWCALGSGTWMSSGGSGWQWSSAGAAASTRSPASAPAASCPRSTGRAYDVVPIGITTGGPLGRRARRARAPADHRRPAARGRRDRVARGAPRRPHARGDRRAAGGCCRRAPARRRRRLPGPARAVGRGRHDPGPARARRDAVRRLGGVRLRGGDGQGAHEGRAARRRPRGRARTSW